MKKVVLACIGGLTPLLLLGALASATTTTSLDIGKLSGAESRTVALLRQYQPTATWSAQFNAAEANQASDLAKVNSDLWPSHQVRPVSKPRVDSRQKIGALSVLVQSSAPSAHHGGRVATYGTVPRTALIALRGRPASSGIYSPLEAITAAYHLSRETGCREALEHVRR
jgi:hypothetical protein